jgi:Zinc-ribbon containing domain
MPTFSAGSEAPPGDYTCASCSSSITLTTNSPLPTCQSCGGTSWQSAGGGPPDKEPKPIGSI